ncbi:MAG: hypothetical protein B6244_06740 [Candidatus Cloacimonetes bacterium 4572_55]|nr:MAG: hypothetical protein B6244_06740 [Candidatus Cloacimonetes bacterium 4572_55]
MAPLLELIDWIDQNKLSQEKLDTLYQAAPQTECPKTCSDCCRLTEEEMQGDIAVMYPLYKAEYFKIVSYIHKCFPEETVKNLLTLRDERPQICPFLIVKNHACLIYPARPYLCRIYGILSADELEMAKSLYQKKLPESWLREFLRMDSCLICEKIRVNDSGKMNYIDQRARGEDARALWKLSCQVPPHPREIEVESLTEGTLLIWTWGGFNALYASEESWFRSHFQEYWKKTALGFAPQVRSEKSADCVDCEEG